MRLANLIAVSDHASRVLPGSNDGADVRRHEVSFPTAVVDLRPVAAGFDNALAWLARFRGLKAMSVPVARLTRRLVVHVHQIHRQTFAAGTADQHELICLCVTNGGTNDAEAVRFQTRWNAESPLYTVKTTEGLWMGASGRELGQPSSPAARDACLVAGGAPQFVGQHAGLVVKYFHDDHAYVVTPDTYRQLRTPQPTWRSPSEAIAPGLHLVDVAFRSWDGGASLIRLKVMNPGRSADLGAHISVGQLVIPS